MNNRNGFVSCAMAGICCFSSAASHAEGGNVDLVINATAKVYAVQMGESTVTARAGDGKLMFRHGSGRAFADSGGASVQYVGFSRTTPSGLELEADGVATFSPDDTLLLVFQRHADDLGTSNEGSLELTGGTGRFAGISGHCRYQTDNSPHDWNVLAKCQWVYSFPYR
ncbi:MAG: hypothetical protein ACJ8G2_12060 [Burkholderiales bacterium]